MVPVALSISSARGVYAEAYYIPIVCTAYGKSSLKELGSSGIFRGPSPKFNERNERLKMQVRLFVVFLALSLDIVVIASKKKPPPRFISHNYSLLRKTTRNC
jgi:hypothetical protein